LIDRVGLRGFSAWARLRITFERLWLRFAQLHANEYLVQTPSMQDLMITLCRGRIPVVVRPFAEVEAPPRSLKRRAHVPGNGFVYVASGEPHKNHRQLIEAWCLLADENIYPRLVLTVDGNAFPELCCWIDEKTRMHNLTVHNLGSVSSEAMTEVYATADALIYPSTFESLGLPLIEAQQAGIPILAAELDYVRDVVEPTQTFNPNSAISIAKAVKRFSGVREFILPMGSPVSFMHYLTDRRN
jgi:glycosyltransferase involved in cell wall biosynthesis